MDKSYNTDSGYVEYNIMDMQDWFDIKKTQSNQKIFEYIEIYFFNKFGCYMIENGNRF